MESFNGKLRDELLNREVFETLREAQVLTERWRREYITRFGLIALWPTGHRRLRRSCPGGKPLNPVFEDTRDWHHSWGQVNNGQYEPALILSWKPVGCVIVSLFNTVNSWAGLCKVDQVSAEGSPGRIRGSA